MVKQDLVEPEQFRFKEDGVFPNSGLPLLVYRQAFTEAEDRASIIEQCLAENDWWNSWRNGVYPFVHYHSTTHEILGVYCGAATLQLGGENGHTGVVDRPTLHRLDERNEHADGQQGHRDGGHYRRVAA